MFLLFFFLSRIPDEGSTQLIVITIVLIIIITTIIQYNVPPPDPNVPHYGPWPHLRPPRSCNRRVNFSGTQHNPTTHTNRPKRSLSSPFCLLLFSCSVTNAPSFPQPPIPTPFHSISSQVTNLALALTRSAESLARKPQGHAQGRATTIRNGTHSAPFSTPPHPTLRACRLVQTHTLRHPSLHVCPIYPCCTLL